MAASWIPEGDVTWVFPDGRRVPGRIAVSVPEQDEHGDWRCEAWLDGLDHRSWPLVGVTPLRAVVTATEHIEAMMKDFVARGGRILADTGEDLDPLRD